MNYGANNKIDWRNDPYLNLNDFQNYAGRQSAKVFCHEDYFLIIWYSWAHGMLCHNIVTNAMRL